VIRFENVGLRYGMGPEILQDLTFQIEPQSFQFLTGPSGAGKNQLDPVAVYVFAPDARADQRVWPRYECDQQAGTSNSPAQGWGGVPGFPLAGPSDDLRKRRLAAPGAGKDEAEYRSDVIDLLKWVGLGDRMHVLPPVLSGGEKQRAAIARALITRPEVLLADEPTGNVDPPLARRLLRLFIELNKLGTSVVIATHDIALLEQVDARRMVLAEGRLTIFD
jgi:cell division transport system ATP-binding protein